MQFPPANAFSPFYSWDAYMGLVATAFRRQGHGIDVAAIMQTIGTENLGSKVGVAATVHPRARIRALVCPG